MRRLRPRRLTHISNSESTTDRDYRSKAVWLQPLRAGVFLLAATELSTPAFAAGSNMPWEQPLNQILQLVEGPVAKIIAVIIIITTGLTLAFGDTSGGFRRLVQIVFGLSIAFAASSFFVVLSSGGGALI